MAAALDYCMRCVGVPLALLVNPISNSLLPEMARRSVARRLRSSTRLSRWPGWWRSWDCAFGVLFRREVIALLFERGSFTAESTSMVAAVFLGFGPSLIGWSLIEITARSLFGMNRPWLPVIAGAIPVLVNVVVSRTWTAGRSGSGQARQSDWRQDSWRCSRSCTPSERAGPRALKYGP